MASRFVGGIEPRFPLERSPLVPMSGSSHPRLVALDGVLCGPNEFQRSLAAGHVREAIAERDAFIVAWRGYVATGRFREVFEPYFASPLLDHPRVAHEVIQDATRVFGGCGALHVLQATATQCDLAILARATKSSRLSRVDFTFTPENTAFWGMDCSGARPGHP